MNITLKFPQQSWHQFTKLPKLVLVLVTGLSISCAKLPPGSSSLSGRQITVYMTLNGTIEPTYYFFCINKYGPNGTLGAHGPVAVLDPVATQNLLGLTNGFVTGSPGSSGGPDYGVTDFVLYNGNVGTSTNVGLYHFPTNNNPNQYGVAPNNPVQPLSVQLPDEVLSPNTISFTIDMVSLVNDPTADMTTQIAESKQIRYLQVNIIATNTIDKNPALKEVDTMGDGHSTAELSSFLVIDLSQIRTYSSKDQGSVFSPEPLYDVYSNQGYNGDSSLDLQSWRIDVRPNQKTIVTASTVPHTRPHGALA